MTLEAVLQNAELRSCAVSAPAASTISILITYVFAIIYEMQPGVHCQFRVQFPQGMARHGRA